MLTRLGHCIQPAFLAGQCRTMEVAQRLTPRTPGGLCLRRPHTDTHVARLALQQAPCRQHAIAAHTTEHPAPASSDVAASTASTSWRRMDVIELNTPDDRKLHAQLVSDATAAGTARALCEGHIYELAPQLQGDSWTATLAGPALKPNDPMLQRVPGWSSVVGQRAPPGDHLHIASAVTITSLDELQQSVLANPSLWCDGTGPSDPPFTAQQTLLATAAELICLLNGRRGVVLVQLHVGWDKDVVPYGPYKPLVLALLQQAAASSDIVWFTSKPPIGDLTSGLTAVLSADKEPFRSWAKHLASFGCQAALEAQSPYYKLLIGRILGYREANIIHHIQVIQAVDQELKKLSNKAPRIPWNVDSRGKKKQSGPKQ